MIYSVEVNKDRPISYQTDPYQQQPGSCGSVDVRLSHVQELVWWATRNPDFKILSNVKHLKYGTRQSYTYTC